MGTVDKRIMKRQMELEAKHLAELEGAELAKSLLATCDMLLEMSECICMEGGDACITDEVYASYMGVTARVKSFYERSIERQRQVNDEICNEVCAQERDFKALKNQQEDLEKKKISLSEDIRSKEKEIAEIPEEVVRLRDRYQEAETELAKLQNVQKECSEEKLKELQDKIEELRPVIAYNEDRAQELKNRLGSFEQRKATSDESREEATGQLMELVNSSLEDLTAILEDTERIRSAADKLMKCRQKWEDYSKWHDSNRKCLEDIAKRLKDPANGELRKSLGIEDADMWAVPNVGKVPAVKRKLDDVLDNLNDLDQILAGCAQAAQKDLRRIRRSAGR